MSEKVKDILEWVYCIVIALVLALLFRYYVATPTIVQQRSMFPTLKHNERLILDRTFRITKKKPQVGDIVQKNMNNLMQIKQIQLQYMIMNQQIYSVNLFIIA